MRTKLGWLKKERHVFVPETTATKHLRQWMTILNIRLPCYIAIGILSSFVMVYTLQISTIQFQLNDGSIYNRRVTISEKPEESNNSQDAVKEEVLYWPAMVKNESIIDTFHQYRHAQSNHRTVFNIASILTTIATCGFIVTHYKLRGLKEQISNMKQVIQYRQIKFQLPLSANTEMRELSRQIKRLLKENYKLKQKLNMLTQSVISDSLTGLANRSCFEGRLSRALRDVADKDKFAVLFIDCDRFKAVNDTYGHASGVLLKVIAGRIRGQLRHDDIVARWGGDEFTVLLNHLRHVEEVTHIIDNIAYSMTLPVALPNGKEIFTSLSIGFAMYPEDATTAQNLMNRADNEMYRIKKGKLSVLF